MHEVHLHRSGLAVDGVLARGVEVELRECVGRVVDVEGVGAGLHLILDAVAVVDDVQRGGTVAEVQGGIPFAERLFVDVDGRLAALVAVGVGVCPRSLIPIVVGDGRDRAVLIMCGFVVVGAGRDLFVATGKQQAQGEKAGGAHGDSRSG